MDYLKTINDSITYIEENITSNLTPEDIAARAGFSKFHYHRIFSAIIKFSVATYIRKRRLSKSVQRLLDSNDKIIDMAFDYGFESSEAFSRSFKKEFGISPRLCRQNNIRVDLFEKIIPNIEGVLDMIPKLVHKEEMYLIGVEGRHIPGDGRLGELWQDLFLKKEDIPNIINPNFIVAYEDYSKDYIENDDGSIEFTHLCAFEVENLEKIPEGMVGKIIPRGEYANFTHNDSAYKCKETFDYIYSTWLPTTNLCVRSFDFYICDYVTYETPDILSPTEIFLPITQ
ncbi:helix-turn-helix domain-containing protein [Oceanirhabdus seepicola]|uniref:AraC family transcriptional regulator n=1 Tax=Oceanirhabdus seepicola TaxID=2828781 RepID=A0A9J6P5V8_9CLOT|nr:GyrI-like domain-containing protein [Oceanirhabdus seepicola]MCM1990856.1 AraC family transcriptional regulator [Oceanirhabdus seepicola]